MTQCNQLSLSFETLGRREVVGRFDGGHISSFGGVGLLMMAERATGVCRQLAACFTNRRAPDRCEHPVEQMVAQRLFAPALGYEDLNDHDRLRFDPLVATPRAWPDSNCRCFSLAIWSTRVRRLSSFCFPPM